MNDEKIKDIAERIVIGKAPGFHMDDQGIVWFGKNDLCARNEVY